MAQRQTNFASLPSGVKPNITCISACSITVWIKLHIVAVRHKLLTNSRVYLHLFHRLRSYHPGFFFLSFFCAPADVLVAIIKGFYASWLQPKSLHHLINIFRNGPWLRLQPLVRSDPRCSEASPVCGERKRLTLKPVLLHTTAVGSIGISTAPI